jgi:hypothetical protein
MLGLGFPTLYGVSPRFASAIAKFSGAKLTPVEISGGPTGYMLLGVTGRCGSVDYHRSVEVRRLGKFVRLRGLFVDEPDSDADFAVPTNRETILITSRVANVIRSAGFSNVHLVSIDQVEFDISQDRLISGPLKSEPGEH